MLVIAIAVLASAIAITVTIVKAEMVKLTAASREQVF
jgi:hypothetical protein